MSLNTPLSSAQFATLIARLGPFPKHARIAVATSGGIDSLCLAALTAEWATSHHYSMVSLIVDHKLRHNSTEEAYNVARQLEAAGINTQILTWQGSKPSSCIQEKAREARYHLLLQWCNMHDYTHLFVAHHAQDQQETVLWRLLRGSDLWGLAGMSAKIERQGITICRPLLTINKQQLQTTLERYKLNPVEDPSNTNQKFSRVQIRTRLPQMPSLPSAQLGRIRRGFEKWRDTFIRHYVHVSPFGYLMLDYPAFCSLPYPFQEFLMGHLLRVISYRAFPIRRPELLEALRRLCTLKKSTVTLGGCLIRIHKNQLFVIREWKPCEIIKLNSTTSPQQLHWDNRFQLELNSLSCDLTLKSLGESGWHQLDKKQEFEELHTLPYHARLALPALWEEDRLRMLCHFPSLLTKSVASIQSIEFHPQYLLLPAHLFFAF